MDSFTQKTFDRITSMDVSSMNRDEKNFVRARQSYLNEDQLKKFDKLLKPKQTKEKTKK